MYLIRWAPIWRIITLIGILFLAATAFSQTYHATGNSFYPSARLFTKPTAKMEFSISALGQAALIVDPEKHPFTKIQWGGNGRGLYYFSDQFAAGITATQLTGIMRNNALSYVKWTRLGTATKLILTPQVVPHLYLLVEAGLNNRTSRNIINGTQSAHGLYVQSSIGTELELTPSLGLFFEYGIVYSNLPNINKLMYHTTRWSQTFCTGISFYW